MTCIQLAGEEVEVHHELLTHIPAVALNGLYSLTDRVTNLNENILNRAWQRRGPAATPEEMNTEYALGCSYRHSKKMSETVDQVYAEFSNLLWNIPDYVEAAYGWHLARQYIEAISGAQKRLAAVHSVLDEQIDEMREALHIIREAEE